MSFSRPATPGQFRSYIPESWQRSDTQLTVHAIAPQLAAEHQPDQHTYSPYLLLPPAVPSDLKAAAVSSAGCRRRHRQHHCLSCSSSHIPRSTNSTNWLANLCAQNSEEREAPCSSLAPANISSSAPGTTLRRCPDLLQQPLAAADQAPPPLCAATLHAPRGPAVPLPPQFVWYVASNSSECPLLHLVGSLACTVASSG